MLDVESLPLPPRPDHARGLPAAIWREPMTLPTYAPKPPERYPVYLDRRVYQGSSGRVYPLPFHHQIETESRLVGWDAVHLENAWMRVVVLPELGGRLHVARDRSSGYDLVYANPVIKPALVGLAGPWIAGGIELNWPQHHRPATFLPTDARLETEPDGAVVVWCSDHDPFTRMKAMHGFRLRPDSSVVELEVRLYNRDELTRSFLWWANVAARVDDDYQSFFPHDVTHVADHARRAVTAFPHADCPYYGIDYPAAAGERSYASDGALVSGDRLDWYRNIPVPTSYMALGSSEDFFGGYDHGAGMGFVHVADHQVAVGKKQWTWGNAPFGHAWDRNLSDDGAHYIELMAGVFTDNQPDFSYLAPGETKAFTQAWYPIRSVGPVDRATVDSAVSVRRDDGGATVGVVVTRSWPQVRVEVRAGGALLADHVGPLDPAGAVELRVVPPAGDDPITVSVTAGSRVLLELDESRNTSLPAEPDPATEPRKPEAIESLEELALVATHLELYRHATRSPEPYWREALRRDPGHTDSLVALAERAHASGETDEANALLVRATARLTANHANPRDTRALYLHGLVREALGDDDGAYDLYGRASWMRLWRAPAGYRMARIDARAGRDDAALHRLSDVLRVEPEHLQALALVVVCHRRLAASVDAPDDVRHRSQAESALQRARQLDGSDAWLAALDGSPLPGDVQTCLDVAIEAAGVGDLALALDCLDEADARDSARALGQVAGGPMIAYHRAAVLDSAGRSADAGSERARAQRLDATWCHPSRLADAAVLRRAVAADPSDARARALLGHWTYAAGRHEDAAALWRESAAIDARDPVVQRNLALTAANDARDLDAARDHYRAAIALAPDDARLLFEADQLAALLGDDPAERLARLDDHAALVAERDDLTVERLHLQITLGRSEAALTTLRARTFGPWEGGEGQVLSAWDRACVHAALTALAQDEPVVAAGHLRTALAPPSNLGEARHPLASTAPLHLLLGDALAAAGDRAGACASWEVAAIARGDFLQMSVTDHSETTFWSVLAQRRLGVDSDLEPRLREFRKQVAAATPEVDYFATSLPDLLLFSPDPVAARDRRVAVLDAQIAVLDGDRDPAALRTRLLADDRHAADLRHALATRGPLLLDLPTRSLTKAPR